MSEQNNRLITFLRVLSFLITIMFFLPPATALSLSWEDAIKEEILMDQPRTLKGKAFLDDPIEGATVRILDESGSLLYSIESATGDDGSFSVTRALPESFSVVVADGWKGGEAFGHELKRNIPLFLEEEYYVINAVTNIMAEYQARHPDLAHQEVKDDIATFLSIPDSVDLDEVIYATRWFCYYFSHYHFMEASEELLGLTTFTDTLLDECEEGKTFSFYDAEALGSNLFKDAMKFLLKGASKKLGEEGSGWILGLLNLDDNTEDSRFEELKSDLASILTELDQIKGLLRDLVGDLNLSKTELEIYIEGISAQDAITKIGTHYGPDGEKDNGSTNTLKHFSYLKSEDIDDTVKDQIATLVENINGAWDIENQVQIIHDAIIPDIGNTSGLLDLWTESFLLESNKSKVSDDTLMGYYQTLEKYFSVLLFYQFKGANLVVEALNYQSSSQDEGPVAGETPAEAYLTGTFQPMIEEETDKFFQNVVKLLVHNSGLFSESRFLPGNAQDILARATFFACQTLGDENYGIRLGAFGTKNLVDDIVNYGVDIDPDAKWIEAHPVKTAEIAVDTRPYDYWGTLNEPDLETLRKGTEYTLVTGDFGSHTVETGSYPAHYEPGVYQETKWKNMGEVVVKRYTEDYVEDPDGEILYGYLLTPMRRGGTEVIMDSSVFSRKDYINDHDGDAVWVEIDNLTDEGLHLFVNGRSEYDNSASSVDMSVEWDHYFTYQGDGSVTAHLNGEAGIYLYQYYHHGNNWNNYAKSGFRFGLYNCDTKEVVVRYNVTCYSDADEEYEYTEPMDEQLDVTLEPGVQYKVYVKVWGEGYNSNGGYEYKVDMYRLHHFSLTFVESEYASSKE